MGSSSRASTTTAQTTNQVSRNLNLQDTEGVTVGEAGGDVTIVSTDHNAVGSATDLARRSLEIAENIGSEGLRLSLEQTREVTGVANNFFDRALDFVGDLQSNAQSQIGETVTALNAIAVEQNKSTDQRLQESTQAMLKYTLLAVGVFAGGFVLVSIFRSK